MKKSKDNNKGNGKNQKHGHWGLYHSDGTLLSEGYYNNGTRVGYWVENNLWFSPHEYKMTKTYYII